MSEEKKDNRPFHEAAALVVQHREFIHDLSRVLTEMQNIFEDGADSFVEFLASRQMAECASCRYWARRDKAPDSTFAECVRLFQKWDGEATGTVRIKLPYQPFGHRTDALIETAADFCCVYWEPHNG